ncbi:MAG: cupin domain-containing protein [Nevskiales bacterium]
MEKTDQAVVIPLDAGWSDLGSWDAVAEVALPDAQGNVLQGDVIGLENQNCLLRSEGRLLTAVGLKNQVVVETSDAVLVADKSQLQNVKALVKQLQKLGRDEAVNPAIVHRPWGSYETIADGPRFQVKRIIVKPGAHLSLQMHHHRAEHWVVVQGTAEVLCDEKQLLLGENESTYIPLGAKHRLGNPGNIPLELIEIQSGSYLGEDDIVRFEDRYGRASS